MWDVRYRPLVFGDVLGQEGAVQVLKSRLAKGTATDTSYIFSGGAGMGKTTLGRILGRALLCQNLTSDQEPCNSCENCKDTLDESSTLLSELDSASKGTIEHARAIVDSLSFSVQGGTKRVFIFDEVHRMSRDAQDVLLKPLEDKQLVGIFCTTEPEKIRGPIRSRCEEYKIRKITREHVLARMNSILDKEGVEHEDDAVLTVIDHSGGHVRDVLNKLEMISQLGPVNLEAVRENLNLATVSTFYQILLALGTPAEALRLAEEACDRVGHEEVLEGLAEAAMNSYRLANKMSSEFSYFDRGLATKVYEVYGDSVVQLAGYFLRSYKVSKLSLFSDILACSAGVPSTPTVSSVVVQVTAPKVETTAVAKPMEATKTPSVAPKVQVNKPVALPNAVKPPVSTSKSIPPQDIGVLGKDNSVLTSLDDKLIPKNKPRGVDATVLSIPQGKKESFITHTQFTSMFMDLLNSKRKALFGGM